MKLTIFAIITLIILTTVSISLIISMANYIISYEEWFSFMTVSDAVITLVILSVLLGVILTGLVLASSHLTKLVYTKKQR